ncbi:PP2C family protein-serine/threonine phosphatase [Candidatus Reidiella endopervernicosa]|uniref:SpoIIE family protein phosphatase n=1 Tax=Candidatus Reidiella endopervernicosa TaxID=2738883 RepID=A0A6N0HYP3_9GAMM|nr:response regulator [Candidatus Reidiella endopervernicosa]QKQ27494.1 SpoIIE family protein phosphatase [Candidatus Reidiella endopervernicosa]
MNREATDSQDLPFLQTLTLLIIDDDGELRTWMETVLSPMTKELHSAADAEQATMLFKEHTPDLVITDVNMPGSGGLELATEIKAFDPDIPVLLITGYDDATTLQQAIEIGIDGYLAKPLTVESVMQALAKPLRSLQNNRDLKQQTALLEMYHAAAEEERDLVSDLMERMMQPIERRDERFDYWVAPTDAVSGDLICIHYANNGTLFIMAADSTGHGLPAALNLLPINQVFYRMVDKGFPVSAIAEEMNRVIKEQSPADRFVAATLASIDFRNRIIDICNGGNPPTFLIDDSGEVVHSFASGQLPLGILGGESFTASNEIYRWEQPLQLVLFSDGMTDAENESGIAFDERGIIEALKQSTQDKRVTHVVEAVQTHLGERHAHDDISIIVANCEL